MAKKKRFTISEEIQWEKYGAIINTGLLMHMDHTSPVVEFPLKPGQTITRCQHYMTKLYISLSIKLYFYIAWGFLKCLLIISNIKNLKITS